MPPAAQHDRLDRDVYRVRRLLQYAWTNAVTANTARAIVATGIRIEAVLGRQMRVGRSPVPRRHR